MDPLTVMTAVAGVAPVVGGLASAVGYLRRRRSPRLDLRALPPGSRVVVEVGAPVGDE